MQIDRDKPERTAGDASLAVLMETAEKKVGRLRESHPDVMTFAQWEGFQQSRTSRMPSWWRSRSKRQWRYVAYVQSAIKRLGNPDAATQSEPRQKTVGEI
jgi:hypothetical protein